MLEHSSALQALLSIPSIPDAYPGIHELHDARSYHILRIHHSMDELRTTDADHEYAPLRNIQIAVPFVTHLSHSDSFHNALATQLRHTPLLHPQPLFDLLRTKPMLVPKQQCLSDIGRIYKFPSSRSSILDFLLRFLL